MKVLYLDCFSGISGDMTLAALVDAGADREYVERELAKISIEPFSLQWKRVNKRGVSALKMDVMLSEEQPPHHHRHYSEIVDLIVKAGFNERVTALSLAIFEKIAVAEAKIHDVPVGKVHFHEVGAIDSIVDVIGTALAIDSLQVEKIVSSPIPLGSGSVPCDHGLYPVPAPATLEMMIGLPIAASRHRMEMTTPTGAGIAAGIVDEFNPGLPSVIVESVGYGAGTRDLPDSPNVLRAVVGRTDPFLAKWQPQHEFLPVEHHHEHGHHHHHGEQHHGTHHHHHTHDHDQKHHHHEHEHDHEHEHGHATDDTHPHDHNHGHANRHEDEQHSSPIG